MDIAGMQSSERFECRRIRGELVSGAVEHAKRE